MEGATPLFLNLKPAGVRERAMAAAEAIATIDPTPVEAVQELTQLGAAALPHLLPRLDTFSTVSRGRVAIALLPVAKRMGILGEQDLPSTTEAEAFWRDFWEDRFVDFRPQVAQRVVARYADAATPLRERELRELDTFALPWVMNELEVRRDAALGTQTLHNLSRIASRLTGAGQVIAVGHPSRNTVEELLNWWEMRRERYLPLTGIERLLAPLMQTRYAHWVRGTTRTRFGSLSSGEPALVALRRLFPVTLILLVIGLTGGTAMGMALGAALAFIPKALSPIFQGLLGVVWLLCPLILVLAQFVPFGDASLWIGCVLLSLFGTSLVTHYQRTGTLYVMANDWVRTYKALGASPFRLARLTLRSSSTAALSTLAPHTSTLLTAVFVTEFALGLDGIGRYTIAALGRGDVVWVMLVTVVSASVVGLTQIGGDWTLRQLDPRREAFTNTRDNIE